MIYNNLRILFITNIPMFRDRLGPKTISKLVGLGCVVIFLLMFIPAFFVVVEAGEVGVYSLFGKVSDKPFHPGFNFKLPVARVVKMSTRTQDYTMTSVDEDSEYLTSTSGSNDAIEARAKDGARLWLDITVLYRLQAEKARKCDDTHDSGGQSKGRSRQDDYSRQPRGCAGGTRSEDAGDRL